MEGEGGGGGGVEGGRGGGGEGWRGGGVEGWRGGEGHSELKCPDSEIDSEFPVSFTYSVAPKDIR